MRLLSATCHKKMAETRAPLRLKSRNLTHTRHFELLLDVNARVTCGLLRGRALARAGRPPSRSHACSSEPVVWSAESNRAASSSECRGGGGRRRGSCRPAEAVRQRLCVSRPVKKRFPLATDPASSRVIRDWADVAARRNLHMWRASPSVRVACSYKQRGVHTTEGRSDRRLAQDHLWGEEALFFERRRTPRLPGLPSPGSAGSVR